MNTTVLIKGLIELGIAFLASIFIFFISFKFFTIVTRKIDDVEEIFKNNIAVALLAGAFLFGIMICIQQAVGSSMDNLSVIMNEENLAPTTILLSVARIIVFFVLAAVFSFLILWLALFFFTIFTPKIDEWDEIKKNNIAIAMVLGSFLVITSLFLAKPLATLLDGLIPPPMILPEKMIVSLPLFNTAILMRGAIELCVTLAGVIFTFAFSFGMFKVLTRKIDEKKELLANNIAIAFLLVSFVLGIMIIFRATIEPSNQTIYFALNAKDDMQTALLIAIGKIGIFYVCTAIASFVLLELAMRFFMLLFSKKNELEAIQRNNIAVAIVVGIFVVAMSLMFANAVGMIVSAFTSAPKIGGGLL
jgi:uncharacterized membrane protein YjfL (UPF0719 family)